MHKQLNFIIPVIQEAGTMLKDAALESFSVDMKEGIGNYVTEIDIKIEEFVLGKIRAAFPEDAILSEETSNAIEEMAHKDRVWIIDPLDGTSNFVFRRNTSCVSIGYAEKGVLKMGAVFDPFNNELYTAIAGEGSYLNGKKLSLPERPDNHRLLVGADNSHSPGVIYTHLSILQKIQGSPHVSIRGSAAMALCWVASGKIDIYFHTDIKPWDIAAGMLVVREAGGVVWTFEGNEALFTTKKFMAGPQERVTNILSQITV